MKKIALTLLVVIGFLPTFCKAQSDSLMVKWSSIINKPGLASYFSGMFEHLGIKVKGTTEMFTVNHLGNRFTLTKGVSESDVDYVVELEKINIENMIKHGEDGKIDSLESFKIMSVLFSPLTQSSLNLPIFKDNKMRKMAGVEDLIHVNLMGPKKEDVACQTLIFINEQWLVIPGLYGKAKRVFTLSTDQAILYQRKIFEAKKENKMSAWVSFRKWYVEWRKTVSIKVD